ncbi:MAG: dihydropteroate synthase [Flavobacteriales bacterium]|nr:dihydropteroate synthase [Flavobacteriales bacterium]MCZ2443580.1 dihydropteroate synthase [Flavobacteriales bacterium]
MPKNTQTNHTMQLRTSHGVLDLTKPVVMGILNLTTDSFYPESRVKDDNHLIQVTASMIEQGAVILDLGGMSTRPGSEPVDESTEMNRLLYALNIIRNAFPHIILSVDTWRKAVAEQAVLAGADIINDISAAQFDSGILEVAAAHNLPYVLMHMQGTPANMQHKPTYQDVVADVADFFSMQIERLRHAGIEQIILDPGFGFGKTTAHNYQLLHALSIYRSQFHYPILAGISRKKMVQNPTNINVDEAMHATTAAQTLAVLNGVSILRVHDVKPAVDLINIVDFYKNVNDL